MINQPLTLESQRIRLEPLDARHLPDLMAHCSDEALWELVYADNPFTSIGDAQKWLEEALEKSTFYTFAIVDKSTGSTIGSTRYADMHPEHKKLEIGWTFIAQSHWRTHVNSECKYLLLKHAFEELALNRVALKANGKNMRSRTAIAALGAAYEGTHRAFRIHPRTHVVHDVSYYSILKEEWSRVRALLETRLRRATVA